MSTTLKTMPRKVKAQYIEDLSELGYDAIKHGKNMHFKKHQNYEAACPEDCATFFYEKAVEKGFMEPDGEDPARDERLPVFAKLAKTFKEITYMTSSYETSCDRFVHMGWIPDAHKAVRAAITRAVADEIRNMDGPFGSLPVRSDQFPVAWWGEEAEEAEELRRCKRRKMNENGDDKAGPVAATAAP